MLLNHIDQIEKLSNLLIYEEIRKKCALFWLKNTDFYIEGHTLKTNCTRFLILFNWRKNFCVYFEIYIYIFLREIFHLFTFFPLRFISTQSDFGANKRACKHCTPLIMVSLASSTATGPILVRTLCQNTIMWGQKLHNTKYSN